MTNTKTYEFECSLMPWMLHGIPSFCEDYNDDCVVLSIELTEAEEDIIIDAFVWAWETGWFEKSNAEDKFAVLIRQFSVELYDKITSLANQKILLQYPNALEIDGFGRYEIYPPECLLDIARAKYNS